MAAAADSEFKEALGQFHRLLGDLDIDELQPFGPATVYTASVTLWMMIHQRLHAGQSLSSAVSALLEADPAALPDNRRLRNGVLSSRTGSYSRARRRLSLEITDRVADCIFESLMTATPPVVGDRRAFLLDGTTLAVSPTAALRRAFPPARNQHGEGTWPIVHLLVAHEIAAGVAVRPEIGIKFGPDADSETALAMRLLPRLPQRSIVIADRNFGIFAMAFAARQSGHDALVRMTDQRFDSLKRRAETDADGRLRWTPSPHDRKTHPDLPEDAALDVWLHEFPTAAGTTLRLLTTWPCDTAEAAAFYARRQDVETDIRDLKTVLKFEDFRGKSPEMIRKELAAGIVAYNLVLQVRRLAAKTINVSPRRLSFSGTFCAVRTMLLSVGIRDAADWEQRLKRVLRIAAQRRIPNRPGRSYPRAAHVKRNKSTSGRRPPPQNKSK